MGLDANTVAGKTPKAVVSDDEEEDRDRYIKNKYLGIWIDYIFV